MAISIYPIAGAAGCFMQESGVNPGIWEGLTVPSDGFSHVYQGDGVGGYGFGQFTNTVESGGIAWRCRDYYDWCVSNGHDPSDGNAQLDYIINVEQVWNPESPNTPSRLHYTSQAQFWASTSTNLDDLVFDWLSQWEGVPYDHLAYRQQCARDFYNHIIQHQNDDPTTYSWVTGNFYPSTAQTLNNVMCMYFYLQGYTPGPGYSGDVNGFVNWCIAKCNDPNVGYSQQYREEQTVGGITYYDCSSFVWYGLSHNGFDINATGHSSYAFDTIAMPTDLPEMGFIQIDKNGELKPGDIGVRTDHTEVVYQGGTGQATFMGAHSANLPLADQVSINNYVTFGSAYDSIWRFTGSPTPPGPTPTGKKKMPLWMYLKRFPF